MSFLIDTNIISEVRKKGLCDRNVAAWYASVDEGDLYLSVLVTGEVRKGIELLARIRGEMTLAPMIETNGGPVKIQIVRVEPTEHRLPQPNGQVIALPALADKPN